MKKMAIQWVIETDKGRTIGDPHPSRYWAKDEAVVLSNENPDKKYYVKSKYDGSIYAIVNNGTVEYTKTPVLKF